jgi:hypothetical protein
MRDFSLYREKESPKSGQTRPDEILKPESTKRK